MPFTVARIIYLPPPHERLNLPSTIYIFTQLTRTELQGLIPSAPLWSHANENSANTRCLDLGPNTLNLLQDASLEIKVYTGCIPTSSSSNWITVLRARTTSYWFSKLTRSSGERHQYKLHFQKSSAIYRALALVPELRRCYNNYSDIHEKGWINGTLCSVIESGILFTLPPY